MLDCDAYILHVVFLPAGRARSVRPAGTKIALCSRVCGFVCVCAKLRHFVTMPL